MGDRVLVTGKAGDTAVPFTPVRVVLMKSGDIAQKHAQEQADWQKRGSGGLVTAVDPSSGAITIAVGAKKVEVKTSGSTVYRRYSGDSINLKMLCRAHWRRCRWATSYGFAATSPTTAVLLKPRRLSAVLS